MATKKKMLEAAAGNAGGGAGLDVTDVFSTYLYTGVSADQTITNGIDLENEGGLIWLKNRTNTPVHALFDTERGLQEKLESNTTDASSTESASTAIQSFNPDGFTLGNGAGEINQGGFGDYASWTFRKAPKFFDVVTYTGDGVAGRTISHNLGSVPGCIIVKRLNGADNWTVYHRGIDSTAPEDYIIYLNETSARSNQDLWADTAPTSTEFSVGDNIKVNGSSSNTYVAYLFAHNDGDGEFGPDADQDIIKCGSYTGDNSGSGFVDLGWEPQWILIKKINSTGSWYIVDNTRGWTADGALTYLLPSADIQEFSSASNVISPAATGFSLGTSPSGEFNTSGSTYIYMAIRRGPLAPPESGTEVFGIDRGGQSDPSYVSGFPVDMGYALQTSGGTTYTTDRLRGTKLLATSNTSAEANNNSYVFDYMDGMHSYTSSSAQVAHMWKRAPNFFDVVAYTGDGTAGRTVSHNLGVAPEMMWVKCRNAGGRSWEVYHSGVAADAETDYLRLNSTQAVLDNANFWQDTKPTESVFTLGSTGGVNNVGDTYIAYLFASLDGVSKVGSYTGTGTSQTIDCGFTSGARFILIKRTDSTGDWYVWDTERGIVAGNDPHLSLNTTAAEVTSDDSIDPDSSGFIVNQVSATNINVSSASYIFYAVA